MSEPREVATGSENRLGVIPSLPLRVLTLKLIPRTLAAQTHDCTLAADYLKHVKHRRSHSLSGQHCARSIDEKASFLLRLFSKCAQRGFHVSGDERFYLIQFICELWQEFSQLRLLQNVLANRGLFEIE